MRTITRSRHSSKLEPAQVTVVDREGAGEHGHPPCSVGGASCALQPPRYPVGWGFVDAIPGHARYVMGL